MHEYRIFEAEQFRKDLASIIRAGHEEIASKLRRSVYLQLREHPHLGAARSQIEGLRAEDVVMPDRGLAILLRD